MPSRTLASCLPSSGRRVPTNACAFTRPQYEALRRETNVFSDTFAMLPDIDSRIDGRMMSGSLVTGNFFQVLGVNAALGRTLMPGDDERVAPRPVMVLSHRGWSRMFANDPAVIGRSLLVNGSPYEIVGVMPDGFRGLDVGRAGLLGSALAARPVPSDRMQAAKTPSASTVVGRLKPGLSRETALAGLAVWDSGDEPPDSGRSPPREHHARTAAGNHRPHRSRGCWCSRRSSSPSV